MTVHRLRQDSGAGPAERPLLARVRMFKPTEQREIAPYAGVRRDFGDSWRHSSGVDRATTAYYN